MTPVIEGNGVEPHKQTAVQMIPLAQIDLPQDPINDIEVERVDCLAAGYQKGDPIPAITVFPTEGGRFETLLGQHRVLGRKRAGMTHIPAVVLPERPPPLELLAIRFKENNNHRTLTSTERAEAFFRAKQIATLNNKAVAALFGVSEPTVSRDLQTQESLHPSLKELFARLQLCPKRAYALSRLPSDIQVGFYEQNKDSVSAEGMLDAVTDKLSELDGKKPKTRKQPPVKCRTAHGILITIPGGLDHDTILADLVPVPEGVKKSQRQGLPTSTIPMFMKNPA